MSTKLALINPVYVLLFYDELSVPGVGQYSALPPRNGLLHMSLMLPQKVNRTSWCQFLLGGGEVFASKVVSPWNSIGGGHIFPIILTGFCSGFFGRHI